MATKAQSKARERYHEKSVLHVSLGLNRNTEPELVARMERGSKEHGGNSNYLKHLIRRDISS